MRIRREKTGLYGLAASSASLLIVVSSRPTSVNIDEHPVLYCGFCETSPMNSRKRFKTSTAPSSLERIISPPQAGQAKAESDVDGAPSALGGEKKLPSKTWPAKHSQRLNYVLLRICIVFFGYAPCKPCVSDHVQLPVSVAH